MQISIKQPFYTHKTSSVKQSINSLKQPYFQYGKDEVPADRDCFTKSCLTSDKKLHRNNNSAIRFGNKEVTNPVAEKDTFANNNPSLLDETARLKALHNIDIPISGKKEYLKVIERIKNARRMNGEPYDAFDYIFRFCPQEELGLLPYIGDESWNINRFLSGRMHDLDKLKLQKDAGEHSLNCDTLSAISVAPENYRVMEDLVRALDYSLGKLDNEFGKYEGIVFRQGFMDTDSKQYFSASQNPEVVAERKFSYTGEEYSVIRTKGGHRIANFQKKILGYTEAEEEILLDRKSKFKFLPPEECDDKLLEAKEKLADCLFKTKNNSKFPAKCTREQILDLIKVYDEI